LWDVKGFGGQFGKLVKTGGGAGGAAVAGRVCIKKTPDLAAGRENGKSTSGNGAKA